MQNDEPTIGLTRRFNRIDDLLTWRLHTCLGGFGNGLTGYRHAITMQISTFQKTLHQKWDAAGGVHVRRHVFAKRLDIRYERPARTNRIKIVNVQVNACFTRQSQKVENGIRRSTS